MLLPQGFPKFENYLAPFVADMRAIIFSSQVKTARYFNLTHTTVSRYESGQLTPPVGYIACLAQLVRDQSALPEHADDPERTILDEVNKAIRWCYREKEPLQKPLRAWDDLLALAGSYLHEQRGAERPTLAQSPQPAPINVFLPPSLPPSHMTLSVSTFCNRCDDADNAARWLTVDRYRVVGLLGVGGIGKTFLAAKVVDQAKLHFQTIIWRSLHDAPPLESVLADCLGMCADRRDPAPIGVEEGIARLVEAMNRTRCLIVFDNFDAVLQPGDSTGRYREGYGGYGRLLRRIGEVAHQSCLVLTSREKPRELGLLEGTHEFARSMVVGGLVEKEALDIVRSKGVFGTPPLQSELVVRYAGNPFALKVAAGTIRDIFGGDISEFLQQGEFLYGEIAEMLTEQFRRLPDLEQAIVAQLADTRTPTPLADIFRANTGHASRKAILEAVESLHRRAFVERVPGHIAFTLQPLILGYAAECLAATAEPTQSEAKRALMPFLKEVLN